MWRPYSHQFQWTLIQIVQQKLSQDPTLSQRTNMSIQQIIKVLEFCLKNTYFPFQGKYYEQVHGAAMGPLISPLIANLFMEKFEVKALSTVPHTPTFGWGLLMTLLSSKRQNKVNNSCITSNTRSKYTVHSGGTDQDGSLHFLDTKVTPGPNNTLITSVYRKPIHTDQYLHWVNNHYIAAKHSVYNTLVHRAKVVSSNQPSLTKELDHIKMALQSCHFSTSALNKLQNNFECRHYNNNEPSSTDSQHNNHNNNGINNNNNNKNISIVVPYIQNITYGTQGEGHQTTERWGHIQIPAPTNKLSWGVHWRDWQSIWGQTQRTSQGPIPHPPTCQLHWTPNQPRLF